MSKTVARILLVGLIALGCSEPPDQPIVEGEVRIFLEQYMEALSARDADRIRAVLVEDGRFAWVEDGEVRYRSATDLLAGLQQFPPDTDLRTVLSDLVVVPVGETGAHAWARFRTTIGEGPDGFSFGGAISFVLERQTGSWKLVGGHTSAPGSR